MRYGELTIALLASVIATLAGCERSDNRGPATQQAFNSDAAMASAAVVEETEVGPGDVVPPLAEEVDQILQTDQENDETAEGFDAEVAATATGPTTAPTTAALASEPPDLTEDEADFFYDELAPYGQWIYLADYGTCWKPNVPIDWRPYTLGNWVYTDDSGWYWASDEPFGWVTYHYGRWALVPGYGWCWVPGRIWGPGWVTWRRGPEFVGWAPLPPVRRHHTIVHEIHSLHPFCFNFVEDRFFLHPRVRDHCLPITRNVTLIRFTKDITRFDKIDHRFINRGVDVRDVERVVGKPVKRLRTKDVGDKGEVRVRDDHVAVFRPQLPPRRKIEPPRDDRAEREAREERAEREARDDREARQAADRMAPRAEPQPRFERFPSDPPSRAEIDANRRQREEHFKRMQSEMEERHERERRQPPPRDEPARQRLEQQQQRETRTFQRQQRRDDGPPPDRTNVRRAQPRQPPREQPQREQSQGSPRAQPSGRER